MKLIIAIVLIVLGLTVLLFAGSDNNSPSKNKDNYLTPVSGLRDAHGLAVDVEDPNKLWIASHTGLNLLKDDKDLYIVGSSRDDFMGFSTHPTDSDIFFTSGHPAGGGNLGFQKTTDAGRTWQKVSDGLNGPVDFHSMTVDRVNPDVVYGIYQGRMQKSVDGGKSWQFVDATPLGIIQLSAGANENTVYAATGDGLYVSSDQGKVWSGVSPELAGAAVSAIGVHPNDGQELTVYSQKLGLARTTNDGSTWTKLKAPFADEVVMYIAYDKNNPGTIYTLTRSLDIFKTTDSGVTWKKIK